MEDPTDMSKLSEKYVAFLVEKQILHPIKKQDVYQTLKDLLYQFIANGNPVKANRTFHAEFKQALKDHESFQNNRTFDRFLLICEKLIYKWQQVQFQYDFRNDKRAQQTLRGTIRRAKAASRPVRHQWRPQ